jgi:hypothetical protein
LARGGRHKKEKRNNVRTYYIWHEIVSDVGVRDFFIAFSNSPCRETPKNALKRIFKTKKMRMYFFCELAQMYVVFPFYLFLPPLALGAGSSKTRKGPAKKNR